MAYSPRNPNGQATMANSEPVVLASDHSDVKITLDGETVSIGTSALPTGAATETTLASLLTSSQLIDDTVAVLGTGTYTEATSKGLIIGAVRRDADTTLVDTTNEFAPLQLDANGRLKVEVFSGETLPVSLTSTTITGTVTVSATNLDIRDLVAASDAVSVHGDVGILDQFDLTNSNPLTVAIVDGSGNQITSFGGGTEYTEDAAAAANPVGKATILVRQDTPATLVDTDGDNVAQRGTNYGAAYVQLVTSAGAFIDSVGGGTQYTEGDTDATITGTAMMMEGAGNALVPAQGTVADGLLVNLGANNDVTVTGTVSATQSGTWNINNISGTISLPTGAATETTLASLLTSSQLIDDAIFTAGTDTYTEATSKGQLILAVRRDADTTLVNTTNEFGPLQMDANGRLKVEVFSGETLPVSLTSTTITGNVTVVQPTASNLNATVVGTGTFAVQESGAALTALQLIDDSIFTDNAAFTDNSSKVTVAGFYFDDAAGTALTENDVAAARIDSKRALVNVIEDATTRGQKMAVSAAGAASVNNAQVAGNTINTGTGASGTGTQRVVTATDSTIGTVTSVTQNADVRQSTASNLNAQVVGTIAHDGVDSGNPVKVGMRAIAHGTNPTAVAAADRTDWYANRAGIPFVIGGHPHSITRTAYISDTTGAQTDASIVGTIAAGTKVVVTRITVTVDSAVTATGGVAVKVGFGATSIPADSATGADGILLDHKGIAAGSGVSVGDGSGILGVGADGEELRLTCEDPVGGGLSVTITYYTIES